MDLDYSLHYSKWHDDSEQHFLVYASFYRRLLAPLLESLRVDASMLDVGCGTGLLVYAMQQAGYHNVSGIDLSPQQIAVAQRRSLPCTSVDAEYLFRRAESEPESLDIVFLMDVLEHIAVPEQPRFLGAIYKLLKPGGHLVLTVPNANSTFAMRWRYIDWTHHLSFTEHSLDFVLLTMGFGGIQFLPYEFGDPPRFPFVHRLGFWTWVVRKFVRAFRRLEAVGELGREGLTIPLTLNLLAVAKKTI